MSDSAYRFITYVKVQPEREAEMKKALNNLRDQYLKNPSCLRCETYQVKQKEHNFIVLEQWKTPEDYQHQAAESRKSHIYQRIVDELSGLLDTQELAPCWETS